MSSWIGYIYIYIYRYIIYTVYTHIHTHMYAYTDTYIYIYNNNNNNDNNNTCHQIPVGGYMSHLLYWISLFRNGTSWDQHTQLKRLRKWWQTMRGGRPRFETKGRWAFFLEKKHWETASWLEYTWMPDSTGILYIYMCVCVCVTLIPTQYQ